MNGHVGNKSFLHFLCQAQLEKKKDFAVYYFNPQQAPELNQKIKKLRKNDFGEHANEVEITILLAHRPDLVKLDMVKSQSGGDQQRLGKNHNLYKRIWWYACFPNHNSGDASYANKELGELVLDNMVNKLITSLKKLRNIRMHWNYRINFLKNQKTF